jgi:acetyltransferase-like isoleucine patch superfamily enzyme
VSREIGQFELQILEALKLQPNRFHPIVHINGEPEIAQDVFIGFFSEINAKESKVTIGNGCDIASFVTINCADSHKLTLGIESTISRKEIHIGESVFIGSHSVIKGGAIIGHHSVIAAGTIVDGLEIPPYSLVSGNPMVVRPRYFESEVNAINESMSHEVPKPF